MKKYNKKTLARVLCLFFVLSAFGGGLISSEKLLGGGQTYAIDLPDNVIEGGIVEVQTRRVRRQMIVLLYLMMAKTLKVRILLRMKR